MKNVAQLPVKWFSGEFLMIVDETAAGLNSAEEILMLLIPMLLLEKIGDI